VHLELHLIIDKQTILKNSFLIFIIFASIHSLGLSQSIWGDWHTIYEDKTTKVQIQYKLSATNCQNGPSSKFRYQITGNTKNSTIYLVYKMDYKDCNGEIKYRQYSLDIGPSNKNNIGIIIESMDFSFVGDLINPGYNGMLNNAPLYGSGPADPSYSVTPNGITGETKLCKGESTVLRVSGGKLGVGANWVWYADSCSASKRISTGDSVTVFPSATTTYFVRAEGSNNSDCVKLTIECYEISAAPSRIDSDKGTSICQGESIILTVVGNNLTNNASWNWFKGDCEGTKIPGNSQITVKPDETTTYCVRSEGHCNIGNGASITINVAPRSTMPSLINTPAMIRKNKRFTLSVNGGQLAPDARWEWYENSCLGSKIGVGSSVNLKAKKPTTYFVKAVGGICDNLSCINVPVYPLSGHKLHMVFTPADVAYWNKFLHFGIGVGVERYQFTDFGYSMIGNGYQDPTFVDSTSMKINVLSPEIDIYFHPYITDFVSIGFSGGYSRCFIAPLTLLDNNPQNGQSTKESFSGHKFKYGAELAGGCKGIKLLLKYNRSNNRNYYHKTTSNSNYITEELIYDKDFNIDYLSSGLRFAGYSRKEGGNKGNAIDLTYTLSRKLIVSDESDNFNNYKILPDWEVGFGFRWWHQTGFDFRIDLTTNTKQKNFSEFSLKNAGFSVSLIILWDWFL
jgi:hypothetical protein